MSSLPSLTDQLRNSLSSITSNSSIQSKNLSSHLKDTKMDHRTSILFYSSTKRCTNVKLLVSTTKWEMTFSILTSNDHDASRIVLHTAKRMETSWLATVLEKQRKLGARSDLTLQMLRSTSPSWMNTTHVITLCTSKNLKFLPTSTTRKL